MKPRDLIEVIAPKHVPTLQLKTGDQRVLLKCSCGYKTERRESIEFAVAYPEISTALRDQWLYREMHEHLLDQEVAETAVVDLLGEVPSGS